MPLHDTDQEIETGKKPPRRPMPKGAMTARAKALPFAIWRGITAAIRWIIMLPVNVFYWCVGTWVGWWPKVRLILVLFGIIYLFRLYIGADQMN